MTGIVDVLRPIQVRKAAAFDIGSIFLGSILLALCAQVVIPFVPVPLTLHVFGVLVIGALLGSKRGVAAVITYLTEGALGFPVFSGASGGLAKIVGPTGGYLLAFIAAAFIVGFLLERGWRASFWKTLFAMAIASAFILIAGSAWLSFFVGVKNAIVFGLVPFIVVDAIKVMLAAGLVYTSWKAVLR